MPGAGVCAKIVMASSGLGGLSPASSPPIRMFEGRRATACSKVNPVRSGIAPLKVGEGDDVGDANGVGELEADGDGVADASASD